MPTLMYIWRLAATVLIAALAPCGAWAGSADGAGSAAQPSIHRTIFTVPNTLELAGGKPLAYENGFMLVPENRQSSTSRLIAVRYLRFIANEQRPAAAPVFLLPGGPGTLIDENQIKNSPWVIDAIRHSIRSRDLIIIQQRGIEDGIYAASPTYDLAGLPVDKQTSAQDERARLRAGITAATARWAERGIDLRGYSIREVVADVDDLRRSLGHEKIVLYGGSFGSQWSFAYLKSHPDRVERALLTSVEPLDYGWDDPATLWNAVQRIGAYADRDPKLAAHLPKEGLRGLFKQAILKLEESPAPVTIVDPTTNKPVIVAVGPQDMLSWRYPVTGTRRNSVEALPLFLAEIARGDFRYLATRALRNRRPRTEPLMPELIDTSLSISQARERTLASHEEALRWVGDPNVDYKNIRDLLPVALVGDSFLADFAIASPLVVLHGDVDLSTPLENALGQRSNIKNGKVIVVRGATHDIKTELLRDELTGDSGRFAASILKFLTAEMSEKDIAGLPDSIELSPFQFLPLDGPGLYDRLLATRGSQANH